jgi:TatD DNase family protein
MTHGQFFDTHCHLNSPAFEHNWEALIQRFEEDGLVGVINVAYDIPSAYKAIQIHKRYRNTYATVGIHPHEAKTLTRPLQKEITKLGHSPEVIPIGESGLDFYRNLSSEEKQYQSFEFHLELADATNKPIIIHVRDAYAETMDVLKRYKGMVRGVIHTFGGDESIARQALDLGYYLSFSGVLTYKKSGYLRELVKKIPLDRILIETDCPYLAPHPHRGKENQPAYIRYTAETLAGCLEKETEEIAALTGRNARCLFQLS